MAELPKVEGKLDVAERMWLHVALAGKRDQILRSRNKEVTGSDIWALRGKEIEVLNFLIQKYS